MMPRATTLLLLSIAACASSPPTPTARPLVATKKEPASAPASRAAAAPGEPIIGQDGPLPRETIRRVILERMPELRQCYLIGRSLMPDMTPRIPVQLTIDPTGHISHVEVQRPLPVVMIPCLVRALGEMTFPPSLGRGIVKVSYPLVFESTP